MSKNIKKIIIWTLVTLVIFGFSYLGYSYVMGTTNFINSLTQRLRDESEKSQAEIKQLEEEVEKLNNEDQRKRNNLLKEEIDNLKEAYKVALANFKKILDIEDIGGNNEPLKAIFATILDDLAKDNLLKAGSDSAKLAAEITKESNRLKTLAPSISANVPEKNDPPTSGYSRQKVKLGEQFFVVDIIAADLNSTKVIVDTASDSTCTNDCPVLPLATYVSRSGAYAGINGTYFCPETYPDCATKKNTFDVLVMNKNKVYFNSDNNVYSSVPAAIFSGNSARFVRETSSWGRDSGVDSVIANRPLLMIDGNVTVSTTDQNKENLRGNRGFLASKDSMAYIGVVRSATVGEAALVLKELGIKNAINLDSGGSTALWSGGYKAGPGRNIPNAVLFVKK